MHKHTVLSVLSTYIHIPINTFFLNSIPFHDYSEAIRFTQEK